ncbi:putative glycoside hydrolase [Ferrovum sp.]|uniref:putative glycoside hydrolase n=1 Tax=Ferrovum sp. TaxID=2609467 RepID=UPI0026178653|nr:putative glycoside hydrolase [Ferrovum sp.]
MKNFKHSFPLLLLLWSALSPVSTFAAPYVGTVLDADTRKPIENAFVTLGFTVARTDPDGKFTIDGNGEKLCIRAYGHVRREVPLNALDHGITLNPFIPKAIYLSFYGIGDKALRASALGVIQRTEVNALVIDLKGDRGGVSFKSTTPLATQIGARKITTIEDIQALVSELHAKGIYAIGRIVVFKDDPLATARPDLALRTADGAVWKDREGLSWPDPFNKMVWRYNIDLAEEAARAGFDEIQFDYVRFPDSMEPIYPAPNTEKNRVETISGFLAEARKRLVPYNVFLAADIFGYVAWNTDDTHIGQKLQNLAEVLDYLSFMLYPSGFKFGIPGYPDPVQHPREIVLLSLERAQQRSNLPAIRFRPWLQAFRDYAFDRRLFQTPQIRAQIEAADHFGSDGWMLWNPHNLYGDGLQNKPIHGLNVFTP